MVIDVFGCHTLNVEKPSKPKTSLSHGQFCVCVWEGGGGEERGGLHQSNDPVNEEIHTYLTYCATLCYGRLILAPKKVPGIFLLFFKEPI